MAHQPTKSRKFLAGTVTAALVATAIVPTASAAEFSDTAGNTHEDAINALVDLGVINGYPDGTFQPNKTLSRSDVVKMMGKWLVTLGYEVPADYASVQRFDDVSLTGNQELLKYAALVKDTGVFNGSEGKLDPTGSITRENMALVLVRAFDEINGTDLVAHVEGEEFDQEVTDLSSAKAEARPFINVLDFYDITSVSEFMPKSTVTRGQFATFLYKTSKVEAPVDSVEVASVSAINLKQVLVTFNSEVNAASAELAANYTYTGTTTIASRELQADKKSVLITLTAPEAQQASATLKVANVTDVNGVVVPTTTKTINFLDTTVPSAVSATLVAPTKVQIKFSEPVKADTFSNAAFSLDNNTYSLSGTPTLVAGTLDTIEITLGTVLPAGSHTIKVNPSTVTAPNAVKDFAGFVVPTTDVTFNYTQDTTAPVASLVSASQTTAVFEFEDAVQFAGSGLMNTDFTVYHTFNNQASYKGTAVLGADNKTLTVTFAAPIPQGNVNFFLNNTTNSALELEDAWGNKVASSTLSATVSADNAAPTVSKVEKFDSTHVDVTFNEAVTGIQSTDFTLTDSTGANVAISGVSYVSGNTYRLNTAALNGNTYTLKIAADSIVDTSINANKIAAYQTTFVVADTAAPTVTGTGSYTADGKKVFVKFSEAMATSGAGSVLDVNNYRFTSVTGANPSALPANTSITLGADGKSVVITFPAAVAGLGSGNFAGVTVAQVKDLAGNSTTSLSNLVTLAASDLVAANVSKVKATSRNTVSFEVDSNLSSIDVSKFTVDGVAATSAVYVNNGGVSTVTVTAPGNQWATDISDLSANAVVIAANGLTTDQNISNASAVNVSGAADYISASIASRTIADTNANGKLDTVVVTFSETVQPTSVAFDSFTVEGYTVSDVNVAGATATLTLTEKAANDLGATPKVQLVKAVRDASAQHNVTAAETTGSNATDATPPNAAPVAAAVAITGTPTVGQTLTGNYTYSDANSDLEGTSTYRWLADGTAIAGATSLTYVLTAAEQAKVITFEVTPKAATGTATGTPVTSAGTTPVAP